MQRPKMLFIVGSGRCGSSWVLDMLLRHPAVQAEYTESKLFQIVGPFLCKGIPRDEHRKAKRWFRTLFFRVLMLHPALAFRYVLYKYHRYPEGTRFQTYLDEKAMQALIVEARKEKGSIEKKMTFFARSYFSDYLSKHNAKGELFVEKTPAHIHYLDKILSIFPEAFALEMIRDGRDVCVSLTKRAEKLHQTPEPIKVQMRKWKMDVIRGEQWRKIPAFNGRIKTILYEDLLEDAPAGFSQILAFAGLDNSKAAVNALLAKDRLVSGGFSAKAGAWKKHLSPADIRTVYSEGREVLARYRYLDEKEVVNDSR